MPEFASHPLALGCPEGAAEWREKAAEYVGYVAAWLDRSDRDGRWERKVDHFDAWLRLRAKRQEQLERGEFSRWDRVLGRLLPG
ncbi:hypothetical protein [Agrococcus sp. BE272]|uniref:hypothetical protein n=1 Tax=Agrococcus sp. BE272 TaxID=2817727 RepID=UPI00285D6CDF|nr:hypothetical protein [Agrococcus sp. BE272]MDR7234050.1 hypothetical protein [Agrococcus sp. BE272]